jgi:2-polyprenyl-3-methyl-5-hydroxy-6-metoxy-1,4-benzoquinol methylase
MNKTHSSGAIESTCPVCESCNQSELIAHYTVVEAARQFCTETRDPIRNAHLRRCIARLWEGDECLVLRCRECGFGYGFPHIGGDEEFYSILHEQHSYPRWRWEFEFALSDIKSELPIDSAALDFGAGTGSFLMSLDGSWHRYAVEGSPTTRKILQDRGITVFRNLAEVLPSNIGCFRLITLFQVLEHIAEFSDTLKMCRKIIHPQGQIVISVPDGDAMIEQERVTGCADMPPNHINKWTPKSLALALEQADFSVDEVKIESPSWKTLKNAIYLRILTDAARPRSLARQVYRLRSRPARIALMPLLALPAAAKLIPHWRYLRKGGSFAVRARPVDNARTSRKTKVCG